MSKVLEGSKRQGMEEIVNSDTFTSTGKTLGYGCWGIVAEYKDPAGQRWALKRFSPDEIAQKQMKDRKITEEDVMRKEAIPISAAQHYLVPRIIERDKKGKMFIGMPVYSESLEPRLYEIKHKPRFALDIIHNISEALSYLHVAEGRAHGDLKPGNVLFDKDSAFLTDLGSSTCISVGRSSNPRDRIGDANYRAPEGFLDGSHPTNQSDVFSAGALLYKMLTWEGIYDGLESVKEGCVDEKEFSKNIKTKMKKIPRKLRRFLKKCLTYDQKERYQDGQELKKGLEKSIESFEGWKILKKNLERGAATTLPVIALIGVAFAGYYKIPRDVSLPKLNYNPGIFTLESVEKGKDPLIFERENLGPLPERNSSTRLDTSVVRNSTDNRNVATLLVAYLDAARGAFTPVTDAQYEISVAYSDPVERQFATAPHFHVAKCVEYAITKAKTHDGRIDLEDTCAIARLGLDKVNEARYAANSRDFGNYIDAKNGKGERIIPVEEREFLKTWLSYID